MSNKAFKITVTALLLGFIALYPLSYLAYKAHNAELIERGENCRCCGLAENCEMIEGEKMNKKTYFVIQYYNFDDCFRIVNEKPFKTLEEANIFRCECLAENPEGRYVIKADDEDF